MPKMSGPQSDKDVLLYREMAGRIGDTTIPTAQRLKALETVEALHGKYAPADGAGQSQASPALPQGMSRQIGTSGGKPVYEDAQGRRFFGG